MKKTFVILFLFACVAGGVYVIQPELFRDKVALKGDVAQRANDQYTMEPTHVSHVTTPLKKITKFEGVYKPESYTLPNGLQVVVITNKRSPIVKQYVFYKVGSIDDPLGKSGIAHFLEHLMYLGKSKYAPPKQFDKIVKRLGGIFNAYTTFDHTAYFEEVPKDKLENVIKLEAGRMEELHLTDEIVLPERDVILEERNMRIDNRPEAILDEAVTRVLFQNHNFGRSILGWREEMEGLNLKDAEDFHYHWYCPNNAIVVFVGDITVKDVKPLVEKYYAPIKARPIKKRKNIQEPVGRGVQVRLKKVSERVKQPAFEYYVKADSLSYGDAGEVFPMKVAAYILSNGQNSRLYQHFVKEKKLATSAYFAHSGSSMGPGYAMFHILPAPGKAIEEVEKELHAFIKNLLEAGLTAEEVEQAKKRMLNTFAYARDNVFAGGKSIGVALVRGRSLDEVEKMPEYIEAVTAEEVNKYMKKILSREETVVTELLPKPTPEAPKTGDAS